MTLGVLNKLKTPRTSSRTNKVFIHDNGGRPFKVLIHPSSIDIYAKENNKYQFFKKFDFINIWVGKDNCNVEFSNGNSILIELTQNNYLFVGMEIVSFTLKYKVKDYYSPIGRNDVPYPWFIDEKNNVYLLVTPTDIESFPVSNQMIENFDGCSSSDLCKVRCDKSDPYIELWQKKSIPKNIISKVPVKIIHPRV